MRGRKITIIKANGEEAIFNVAKLRHSLQRSGAEGKIIQKIIREIESALYDGITTKEIYKKAFSLLRKHARPSAARYNLKKALFDFGPTGFPFEVFVAELLNLKGYSTKTDQIVQGQCIKHEVDVVAEKGDKHFMIECKFHSDASHHCDVKVPLYIQSRFLDVVNQWEKNPGHDGKFHQGWVVTNTRFTSDAMDYGQCMEMHLLSWDYPLNESLKNWVDETGAHPITCLTTLTKKDKKALLDKGVVLCRHLCERPDNLKGLKLSATQRQHILSEAKAVCQTSLETVASKR